jgi:hypothetical protein
MKMQKIFIHNFPEKVMNALKDIPFVHVFAGEQDGKLHLFFCDKNYNVINRIRTGNIIEKSYGRANSMVYKTKNSRYVYFNMDETREFPVPGEAFATFTTL